MCQVLMSPYRFSKKVPSKTLDCGYFCPQGIEDAVFGNDVISPQLPDMGSTFVTEIRQ